MGSNPMPSATADGHDGRVRSSVVVGSAVPTRIGIAGARAFYAGPGLDLSPHRNAAATLVVTLDAPFRLCLPDGGGTALGPAASRSAAFVPPGTLHRVRATGPVLFAYLDALSDDVAALAHHRDGDVAVPDLDLDGGVEEVFDALGVRRRAPVDPGLVAAVRRLDVRPQDVPSVAAAAALVGLSPSRFQARFRRAVGVPFRRYRLWRRLAVAITGSAAGQSLTEAAHAAGFAGSAHLSGTFRTMFGLTPSDLLALGATVRSDLPVPHARQADHTATVSGGRSSASVSATVRRAPAGAPAPT
ncbi:hypothetical protein GCM10027519_23860 [Kineococcus endophyticus]